MAKYTVGQIYKAFWNGEMHAFEVLEENDGIYGIRWDDGFEEWAYESDMNQWVKAASSLNLDVLKKDVENLLGFEITLKQLQEAYNLAIKKQKYIYEIEHRKIVLQYWYLTKLTEEYVRSLSLSDFTVELCRMIIDMEKEHSAICKSAPTTNHIVTSSVY